MAGTYQRDRSTWSVYFLLAYYSYFLNGLGPITPFLKDELHLSYTVSGLHFTAFAVGTLLIGLAGNAAVTRMGQLRALWLGAFGISVSVALLLSLRSAWFTIGGAFLMGLVGSLILVSVPSLLADRHGELRAVALSEANVTAALVGAAAPLFVGWAAHLPGGWRWALGVVALAPFVAYPWAGRPLALGAAGAATPVTADLSPAAGAAATPAAPSVGAAGRAAGRLPAMYWLYWTALFLAVSIEFCMIFWSANYLTSLGMGKAGAAQAVGLFLAGMVLGRLAGSRLVRRYSSHAVVIASIVVAMLGFAAFWGPGSVAPALAGLFVAGLGVASMYPLLVALALGVAHDSVHASARAALASGTAILVLPLVLGRLADAAGIRPAYGMVAFLLVAVLLVAMFSRRA